MIKTNYKMVDHATVLLYHASTHRMEKTTLKTLSDELGIPRNSLVWLLNDSIERGGNSIMRKTAADCGFDYVIFRGWRGDRGIDEPRLIIDAEKLSLYNRGARLDYVPAQIDFERLND